MKLTISLAQMGFKFGDVEANFTRAAEWVEEAAKRGSDLVLLPELWESGYDLEAMTMHQAQQLNEQKTQIEDLTKDIEALKTQAVDPTTQFPEANLLTLATLIQKNAYIEGVIRDQTDALHRQQEQIEGLETELEHLQFSDTEMLTTVAPPSPPTTGRIVIVQRKIRRAPLSPQEIDNFDGSIFQGFDTLSALEGLPIDRYEGSAYKY